MVLLMAIFSAQIFARYDTLNFPGNNVHYPLINGSNNPVTVDTVKLLRLQGNTLQWSNSIVFDTSASLAGTWKWSFAPFRYFSSDFGFNDSVGKFHSVIPIKIMRNDTIIIRQACQVGMLAKSLHKEKNVSEFMKMVFVRSDKNNDTIIVKINFTNSERVKTTEQSRNTKNKIAAHYLMNGKTINIRHHAAMMMVRKESMINPSICTIIRKRK
jgi:hypothetical protein